MRALLGMSRLLLVALLAACSAAPDATDEVAAQAGTIRGGAGATDGSESGSDQPEAAHAGSSVGAGVQPVAEFCTALFELQASYLQPDTPAAIYDLREAYDLAERTAPDEIQAEVEELAAADLALARAAIAADFDMQRLRSKASPEVLATLERKLALSRGEDPGDPDATVLTYMEEHCPDPEERFVPTETEVSVEPPSAPRPDPEERSDFCRDVVRAESTIDDLFLDGSPEDNAPGTFELHMADALAQVDPVPEIERPWNRAVALIREIGLRWSEQWQHVDAGSGDTSALYTPELQRLAERAQAAADRVTDYAIDHCPTAIEVYIW